MNPVEPASFLHPRPRHLRSCSFSADLPLARPEHPAAMAIRLHQRVGTRTPARPCTHLPVLLRPIPRRVLQPSCSLGLEAVGMVANSFTPVQSGLGGLIIGTSVAAQLLLTGRVLGVSGTVRGVATGAPGAWRPAFIAGLALTAVPLALMLPATMIALPPSFTVRSAACTHHHACPACTSQPQPARCTQLNR